MIVELLSGLAGYLVVLALVLFFVNYMWFETYVSTLALLVEIIMGFFYGFLLSLPKLIQGVLKATATAILSVLLLSVYLVTYAVPFVGKKTRPWIKRIEQSVYTSYLVFKARRLRGMMVEIVAEHDDQNLEFQEPEEYRKQLVEVKEDIKTRLETGETVLSLVLSATLIGSQIFGFQLFQSEFYGFPISHLIQIWLLAIAVSIVYRVSILEFLAYPADAEFDSIEEMDVALSYQKGVALMEIVQGLTVVLVFFYSISNVRYKTVKYVLERKYSEELSVLEWMPLAWKKLNS